MAEYLFANFIEEPKTDQISGSLPLHLTLLHWFETTHTPPEVSSAITPIITSLGVISTYASQEDLFGPNNDVPVVRLHRSPQLLELHLGLIAAVQPLGVCFDDRWIGSKWNPHVTNTVHSKLNVGQPVEIGNVSIVYRAKKGDPKSIIDNKKL